MTTIIRLSEKEIRERFYREGIDLAADLDRLGVDKDAATNLVVSVTARALAQALACRALEVRVGALEAAAAAKGGRPRVRRPAGSSRAAWK